MSLNGRGQRQVKAIKNALFAPKNSTERVESWFLRNLLQDSQQKKKEAGKKRHAECIKTFCLTIFVFAEKGKTNFTLCCFSLENVIFW